METNDHSEGQPDRTERLACRNLTRELAAKGDLPDESLLRLFWDLITNGMTSAIVEMGVQVDGFRDFNAAMNRLGEDETAVGYGKKPVVRTGRGLNAIRNLAVRNSLSGALGSGAIGFGLWLALSLAPKIHFPLPEIRLIVFGLAGSCVARWIALARSHHQWIETYSGSRGRRGIFRTKDAAKAFSELAQKVGSAQDAALQADRIAELDLCQDRATQVRVDTVRMIVRRLTQPCPAVDHYNYHWSDSRLFMIGALGGVVAPAVARCSVMSVAQLLGALIVGGLSYDYLQRRTGFQELRRTRHYQLKPSPRGRPQIIAKQDEELAKRAARDPEVARLRATIAANIEILVSLELGWKDREYPTRGKTRPMDCIGLGEAVPDEPIRRDVDWLLGDCPSDRESQIRELPMRLLTAQAWIAREQPQERMDTARIWGLTQCWDCIRKIENEFVDLGLDNAVCCLAEQLRATASARTYGKEIDDVAWIRGHLNDLLFGKTDMSLVPIETVRDLFYKKTGIKDLRNPELWRLKAILLALEHMESPTPQPATRLVPALTELVRLDLARVEAEAQEVAARKHTASAPDEDGGFLDEGDDEDD